MRKSWKNRLELFALGAFSFSLAIGWWLDHQQQVAAGPTAAAEVRTAEVEEAIVAVPTVGSVPKRFVKRPALPRPKPTYQALHSQNDDLILFVDEAYTLLFENGIHIQLEIEQTGDGHLRLKADKLKLLDQLEAKLQTIDEKPNATKPDN